MPRRPRRFTKKRRRAFLENLERTGNVSAAAEAGEISRSLAYEHRRDDAEFRRAWDDAHHRWLDTVASIAAKRATVGEDVVIRKVRRQFDANGKQIGDEEVLEETRVFKSDRLLAQLLERRHPDYARAARGGPGRPGDDARTDLGEGVTEADAAAAYLNLVQPGAK